MWMRSGLALLATVALSPIALAAAQAPIDGFVAREYRDESRGTLRYRLFVPEDYDSSRAYPLVVYLHGGGGVGGDNTRQISGGNTTGTHVWIAPEVQARHPSFVLAPQAATSGWSSKADLVFDLIAALREEFNLDERRLYLTGQSMGGAGTWDFVLRRPAMFAAAVPLCGRGRPAEVAAIRDLPVWVFHGADDGTVPVERSREMVEALRAVDGDVNYTEYPGVGHGVWLTAYREPELIDWLFAHRRRQ